MSKNSQGEKFIKHISAEALDSAAVNHPYLRAMREGDFPNVEMAYMDFAHQYGLYSSMFTQYVAAVVENLSDQGHKQILLENLAEELGGTHDIELPAEVLAGVAGEPHSALFRRFQDALGVNADYRKEVPKCETALLWRQQFLQLCEMNECVGIGAIGIGTELVVASIYKQILVGLKAHSNLTMAQHVFFDLHSECDEDHAAQIATIAEDLAQNSKTCEQIEYGVKMAIGMRVIFWDKMQERAQSFPAAMHLTTGNISSIGY